MKSKTITRRALLSAAPALAIAPAVAGTSEPRPTPSDDGVIRLRFNVGYSLEDDGSSSPRPMPRYRYFQHVWICPPGVWETLPECEESQKPSLSQVPDDQDWSAQLLEDGRVVAVRLEIAEPYARSYPRDEPDREGMRMMRPVRTAILHALEEVPGVTYVELQNHGNGDARLSVSFDDLEYYIRLSPNDRD